MAVVDDSAKIILNNKKRGNKIFNSLLNYHVNTYNVDSNNMD